MKLKKTLALLTALTLTATFALSGCSKKPATNNSSTPISDTSVSSPDGTKKEPVTIMYGGWEDQLMALELAEKFTARNPHIKVEVFNNGKWLGNEETTKLVATGQMPDIINLENVVTPIQNDWVIDMKSYFEKDVESSSLPKNLLAYGTVNDKLVMLPGAIYLFGLMVNLDLLSANSIPKPEYNWTVDEYINILKKTTKKGATIGTNEVRVMAKHIPAQMNAELGWGTFNETTKKYVLGKEWQYAVQVSKELLDANVSLYEDMDGIGLPWEFEEGSAQRKDIDANREKFVMEKVGETDAALAWNKGKAAMWCDFTWGMGFDKGETYGGFDWDFYPLPVAGESKEARTAFVVDSIAITTSCKNPEAAFEFVSYLSYSAEGIEDRISVVENYNKEALKAKYPNLPETAFASPLTYSQMPVTTNKDVIAKWSEFNNVKPGVTHILEKLDEGYADGFKVTPGFDDAYHNTIEKAVVEQVFTGKKTAADLAAELEEKANKITDEAYAVLK